MEYTGRLKSWYGTFGFIFFEAEERDVFVHLSAFVKGSQPEVDSVVVFQLGPPTKAGKQDQARNVRVIRSAAEVLADFQRRRLQLIQVLSTPSQGNGNDPGQGPA